MRKRYFLFISVFVLIILGCKPKTTPSEQEKPVVLTTTGMIEDAILNLLGNKVEIQSLMGPGVDPHLYQASPGDLSKMNSADVIIYNGLFLEGKLDNILSKLSEKKKVINFSDAIAKEDLIEVEVKQYENEFYDPHIWFDIEVWKQGIAGVAIELKKHFPDFSALIDENQAAYFLKLDSLKGDLLKWIAEVPVENRILVTSHDAFHYYGRMLNIRVEALQGLSTATDFGLKDRKDLVDLIIEEDIKSIFIESSVGDKPIMAILEDCNSRGKTVTLGGTLFSDAMGAKETFEGTYIGMLTHNTQTIVKGLK
jgi:manganese/zinc/iron transport system substrate-binding protein